MARIYEKRTCPNCEKDFTPNRSDKRYCTNLCRWAAVNKERREALEAFRQRENRDA